MMLQTPKEFERVARQWAVIYAGAPSTGAGAGDADGAKDAQLSAAKDDLAQ
jgi:ubiquitin-conjugating enzyme (huntingtin interacting protein 2)